MRKYSTLFDTLLDGGSLNKSPESKYISDKVSTLGSHDVTFLHFCWQQTLELQHLNTPSVVVANGAPAYIVGLMYNHKNLITGLATLSPKALGYAFIIAQS